MEWKIGEIKQVNGEWYQCINGNGCEKCAFNKRKCYTFISNDDPIGYCESDRRKDGKDVIFKKIEKVGEPLKINGKIYQGLISPYGFNNCSMCAFRNISCKDVIACYDDYIFIEVKQNKEDMEEKGQCCDNRFDIIAKAKEALLKETNIARDKQEMAVIDNILFRCWQMGWLDKYDDIKHTSSENSVKNLKPFDLEAAKAGKPVYTRDGRKARIICFDAKGKQPIIALFEREKADEEIIQTYNVDGSYYGFGKEDHRDLMMLPEKKEGWVNVYNDVPIYDTKEKAELYASTVKKRIATVKIEWEE